MDELGASLQNQGNFFGAKHSRKDGWGFLVLFYPKQKMKQLLLVTNMTEIFIV